MNIKLWILLMFLVPTGIFYSCSTCGESVSLGEFDLKDSSIINWFPYINADKLVFRNQHDEEITLVLKERDLTKTQVSYRETCSEGFFESSHEYYLADFFHTQYTTDYQGDQYKLDIYLYVSHINDLSQLTLYDQVTYNSGVYRSKESPGVGGAVSRVASYRGSQIPDTYFDFLNWVEHADSVEIRGKIYQDVFYFLRDGVPSLYVQKQKGVIAFAGFDGELWILQ